jgi:BirA family transcriptional regulator, biotin operon repressor / biotin---[acetyl-CoA-carboxylase] ligase
MTVWLKTTESTMQDAAAMAARGEPHGTVVAADRQTAGIGRHGHTWYSESTGGLYFSIVLRLKLAPDLLAVLTMALGLAAQRAIDDIAGVACDLRWPNDVLLNDRKVAGILVQGGDAPGGALIAGIGVNVNQRAFPPELREIATSLRRETNREFPREALLDRVVAESLRYADVLAERGKPAILEKFKEHSTYAEGKPVVVTMPGGEISGITAGLDEYGYLRVRTAHGVETIVTGGVRAVV